MAKRCTYCGSENDDAAGRCAACETEFAPIIVAAESNLPPMVGSDGIMLESVDVVSPHRTLNARSATLIFAGYFLAQVAVGIVAGFIGVAVMSGPGRDNPQQHSEMMQQITAMAALPTMIVGGAAMLFLSLRRIRPHLRDGSPTGAAWIVGSLNQNVRGFGMGVITAIAYAVLTSFFPPAEETSYGPIAQMALNPGLQQLIWIAAALLFAPLIEECLFRGVLYGGYRKSLGPVWAAILSTFIFWALHLTETAGFWPAMVSVATLALVALWHRLKFQAIGPAVSVHIGYNGMIVLGAVLITLFNTK